MKILSRKSWRKVVTSAASVCNSSMTFVRLPGHFHSTCSWHRLCTTTVHTGKQEQRKIISKQKQQKYTSCLDTIWNRGYPNYGPRNPVVWIAWAVLWIPSYPLCVVSCIIWYFVWPFCKMMIPFGNWPESLSWVPDVFSLLHVQINQMKYSIGSIL